MQNKELWHLSILTTYFCASEWLNTLGQVTLGSEGRFLFCVTQLIVHVLLNSKSCYENWLRYYMQIFFVNHIVPCKGHCCQDMKLQQHHRDRWAHMPPPFLIIQRNNMDMIAVIQWLTEPLALNSTGRLCYLILSASFGLTLISPEHSILKGLEVTYGFFFFIFDMFSDWWFFSILAAIDSLLNNW